MSSDLPTASGRRGKTSEPHERVLRVVWDTQLSSRSRTGTGVYAAQLLNSLRQQPEIEVRTLDGLHSVDGWSRLPYRLARPLLHAAWTQVAVPAFLARTKADVIHAPAYVAPLRAGCPLIVTVHDTMYRRFPDHYPHWWVMYMEWLVPRVLRRAAAVVAVSEAAKRDVVQDHGIDPSRVRVIYHGVDHGRFYPGVRAASDAVLARLGIGSDYVLHVGALVARKNVPLLLDAIAILKTRGCWGSRQVVLSGSSSPGMPGAQTIRDAVDRLDLSRDVVFAGHVPDDLLPALYARASALAFPSLYEGFGLPLLEAMACGVPVVAAAGSAVTEVVGKAGILVPSDDAESLADGLRRVLEEPAVRGQLRQEGLHRAAQFTWEKAARQTVALYREVVEGTWNAGL